MIIVRLDRRELVWIAVTNSPTADWIARQAFPWESAPRYLDHIIVFGEAHLRHLLRAYASYYNASRTHQSLDKGAPVHRPVQLMGGLKSRPILGGLHHQYVRI